MAGIIGGQECEQFSKKKPGDITPGPLKFTMIYIALTDNHTPSHEPYPPLHSNLNII